MVKVFESTVSIIDEHVFNTADFLKFKQGEKYCFAKYDRDEPVAQINFTITNGIAISGHQATFGSFDIANLQDELVYKELLSAAEQEFQKSGISEIIVKHWPESHRSYSFRSFFERQGYSLSSEEINQHIVIDERNYFSKLSKGEKNKLSQCRRKGFVFQKAEIDTLQEIYNLIAVTRNRKGYPDPISADELKRMLIALPERYHIFSIRDSNNIIAAAISITIDKNVLYNFYHADDSNYRNYSPMVMLIEGIYNYAKQHNYKILDVGVSSVEGVINESLYSFKKHIGADYAKKCTFSKFLHK